MAKQPENVSKKATPQPNSSELDDLAKEVAKRIDALVPQGQRSQVVAQMVSLVQEERFSGPIAHPRHLREYDDILPGSANRIITMAENNLEHAHHMQRTAIAADVQDMKDGRRFGFAALIILILSALLCGSLGNNTLALAFLGAGALGVIGNFIDGRKGKD